MRNYIESNCVSEAFSQPPLSNHTVSVNWDAGSLQSGLLQSTLSRAPWFQAAQHFHITQGRVIK